MNSGILLSGEIQEPEFVTLQMAAGITRRSVDFLKGIHIAAGVPSMMSASGDSMYRWSEIKRRLERNNIMPPDENHPMMEYTLAATARIIGVSIKRIYKWVKNGKLAVHRHDDNLPFVYRKDIDWFLRNYDRLVLVAGITRPLKIGEAVTVLGISRASVKTHKGKLVCMPRKRGEYKKYDKAAMTEYASAPGIRTRFRRYPMPEYMDREIARLYMGFSRSRMDHYTEEKKLVSHEIVLPNGKKHRYYLKSEMDGMLLREDMVEAYCDGLPYYTRPAIGHKFGKTDRWINEYVAGKCRRVDIYGHIVPADTTLLIRGWAKEDVEAAVRDNGDEHVTMFQRAADQELEAERKRHLADIHHTASERLKRLELERKRKEKAAAKEKKIREQEKKKADAAAHREFMREHRKEIARNKRKKKYNPIDQIEAAIDTAFDERAEAHREKMRAARAKSEAKYLERITIKDTLDMVTRFPNSGYSKWNRLAYSTTREIFTILFNRNGSTTRGGSMKYMGYRHEGDEYMIHVTDRKAVSRRQHADTSIPRLLARGISSIMSHPMKFLPAWIIMAPSTSYVPDTRFLDALRGVPSEYGAVSPYGFGYVLPDGSHDTCTETYGMYSMYYSNRPNMDFVVGMDVGSTHEVAVMDGPFVAVRGEHLKAMEDLSKFTELGECRSMVGPIVSAVCRKNGIRMASIPVNSVSCGDYAIQVNSLEWNEIIGKISAYTTSNR